MEFGDGRFLLQFLPEVSEFLNVCRFCVCACVFVFLEVLEMFRVGIYDIGTSWDPFSLFFLKILRDLIRMLPHGAPKRFLAFEAWILQPFQEMGWIVLFRSLLPGTTKVYIGHYRPMPGGCSSIPGPSWTKSAISEAERCWPLPSAEAGTSMKAGPVAGGGCTLRGRPSTNG